jgi:hypothetical protein
MAAVALSIASPLSAQTTPARRGPGCQISQNSRVYVGLSDDVDLELYEGAAAIAKQIMRAIQPGVCARLIAGRRRLVPESLRAAFGRGRRVLLDSVHFTDASLQRAYVLLRCEAPDPELVWRVQLHSERGWRIEAVLDEPPASLR